MSHGLARRRGALAKEGRPWDLPLPRLSWAEGESQQAGARLREVEGWIPGGAPFGDPYPHTKRQEFLHHSQLFSWNQNQMGHENSRGANYVLNKHKADLSLFQYSRGA